MAKKPEIPTSGGSYVVKPDGKLDQVEATRPPPPVHTREESAPAAPPVAPQVVKES